MTEKKIFIKDLDDIKSKFRTLENLKKIYTLIDLTNLNSAATLHDIKELCTQARQTKFDTFTIQPVAAVCVYPVHIQQSKQFLDSSKISVASVSAGFPHAQTFPEIKFRETEMALQLGADEIDIVLNLSAFLNGNESLAYDEINTIKQICGEKHLKVILETSILKEDIKIREASFLAMEAGADFIKTSTGKEGSVAGIETFYTMCTAITDYYKKTGEKTGIKAAGGISTTEAALSYYTVVHELLGNAWITQSTFRIGTSRLLQNILNDLTVPKFRKEIKR